MKCNQLRAHICLMLPPTKDAEQAREFPQLREELARTSVKEGLALPSLSFPEVNKALERAQVL